MAYITKRGNSYSVRYTYEDEHGKSCDKWESFPTKEEATNRKKQIEHELAAGTFLIPSSVTVAEFLMDWLPKQCSKHKWAPKTYESNLSTIQNLIIPYIGSMEMQKLKPYHMENLYTTLSKTPCGSYIEGKKQELTEKQKQRFLSGTTIHEVHRLLGTAFQYAVEWGILVKSPVPVDSPKKSTQERTIWTVEEMRAALDSMEDPILHLAVHLTLVGALREGEIVGLTPEDLDFDAADGIGTFRINKSMQRVRKEALNQVDDGCIIKIFPDKLERSTTSLILKSTKTASSCRTIFMTSALKEELKKWLNQLAADEMKDPARYHDSGMLFRLPNGLAVEPVLIRKKFLKWQDAHPEFPRIVFHGLQHSSATYQLMISGGDVKAVQGTTGHATADMLVNTYAHIQQSSRVELGRKFEEGFYAKSENPSPQAVPAEGEPTISMTALLELLTKWYRLWRAEHPEFEQIVFHGLRHSSATYQLLQSDGDFKSVQGNTGHATASVLMDTYAHTQDKPRLELTEKIEANFYSQDLTPATPQPRQNEKPVATKISGKEILEAIRLMDADERRELTRALFA